MIRRERLQRFEQVLWRACRGNVFVQQAEIEEPLEDPSTVSHCALHSFSTYMVSVVLFYPDFGDSPDVWTLSYFWYCVYEEKHANVMQESTSLCLETTL